MIRAIGLASGWLLDRAVGDPARCHPVAAFGGAALAVERRWYRDGRAAGVAYAGVLVGAPAAAAGLLDRRGGRAGRLVLLAAAAWSALGGRSLGRAAIAVAEAVERDELERARRLLPALAGRDPQGMGGPELCRAVVESVAENTADAVVGPLLWGAVAGPAGVVTHRCANTLDAMVGHRSPTYERFGWAAARLDDLLGWLPARVTCLLAVACARLVGGAPGEVIATWRRDGGRHPSPNAGPCEAAFAGALRVGLGGECRYGQRVEVRGPLGDGAAPGPRDVRRAVRLSRAVGAGTVAVAALLTVVASQRRAAWRAAP